MQKLATAVGAAAPYKPLAIADGLWIVEGKPLHPAGVDLPIRMTVIRLASGDLILHSPVAYSKPLKKSLQALGRIAHLVAPSIAHWMFIRDWQEACPDVRTWAAPGLASRPQVRAAGLTIDEELGDEPPAMWADEIDQVIVGSGVFSEVDFHHRASGSLILTDLVLNLSPENFPDPMKGFARLLGLVRPGGGTPIYLQALLRFNRRAVAQAATRLLSFNPGRVIFAHGAWFEQDGAERLRKSLDWLLGADGPRLVGKVVVITGASSGIGRAAAMAFAQEGAKLVLAARRADLLQQVADDCESLGTQAVAVPTDVTDPDAVQGLAEAADRLFGGIDIWVNNAGVGVVGPYQEADIALHRQTISVNLLGTMHGCWSVLPIFLRQNRGVLINNISLGGWAPTPFAAAYTASKFGLRGFTASLRQELGGHETIHICGVFPAMVDTPGFVHGANMSGRNVDPGPFLYTPDDVARTFVSLALAPRNEAAVGWPARLSQVAYATAPGLTERVIGSAGRKLLARAKPAPRTSGAVLEPMAEGTEASGGWLARKKLPPAGVITTGLAVAGGVGLAALMVNRLRVGGRR